ncbi:MAG TPA: metalloregulator ArsR/SmtB family transcription factor [Micrococcaceae bacterium]|jgi:DNA-binding transcriptional ArsR family regulator|nr:metalloregulator ArsR/SmtB family transcription factor [Micrococcaceae bacterium]
MVIDDVFAVIAEETRRDILDSLRAGDKAVGQLVEELGASQPTISKHLRVLREASLVTMRAEGQKRFYSLNTVPLQRIIGWINAFDGGPAGGAGGPGLAALDGSPGLVPEDAAPAKAVGRGVPLPTLAEPDGHRAGARLPAAVTTAPSGSAEATAPAAINPTGKPTSQASRAAQGGAAVVVPVAADSEVAPDGTRQLGRSVGRAANKAADLLANLPKFGRRKD